MKSRIWSFVLTSNLVPIVLIVLAGLAYLKYARTPAPAYVPQPGPTQYVPVPKKVETVRTVEVPGPERIQLVPVEIVREKLKWPELAADNVLAVGSVPPHKGKTSVVAVGSIEDNTLRTRLVMRQEPASFFDLKREIHGGVWYGAAGENIIEGEVMLNPLRIGPVETSIRGRVGLEREDHRLNGAVLVGIEF
jgi:hypothetical protein